MRVVVAMSGGVDSSTVAGLLVEAGHEVIGLAMKTHGLEPRANRACCTPDDMRDARKVADHFNIPFYVLNYEELFREAVIEPFAESYLQGRTPNPCVECNDKVKFRPLLKRARDLGADALATGHYAQIGRDTNGSPILRRGADAKKDQSYFLYRLGVEQLSMLMFPVGGMVKDEVRAHARRFGLSVAEKSESQEICFVGSEGYAKTVEHIVGPRLKARLGTIIDGDGRILGQHEGIHHFTLGQRRGLGVSAEQPLYVTGIDPESGSVKVGPKNDLLTESITIENLHWAGELPAADEVLLVQQRYREAPKAARIVKASPHEAMAVFVNPESRGAPGQAAVIYRNDQVVGGGAIAAQRSTVAA